MIRPSCWGGLLAAVLLGHVLLMATPLHLLGMGMHGMGDEAGVAHRMVVGPAVASAEQPHDCAIEWSPPDLTSLLVPGVGPAAELTGGSRISSAAVSPWVFGVPPPRDLLALLRVLRL